MELKVASPPRTPSHLPRRPGIHSMELKGTPWGRCTLTERPRESIQWN